MIPEPIAVNVLLVDDLQENLIALEALIRQPGRRIFTARSGEEALSLMLEHAFALAILDVQMPSMNGFELAELMRGTERTRSIHAQHPHRLRQCGGSRAELRVPGL
jgi:CheY-like chemotaxis protein